MYVKLPYHVSPVNVGNEAKAGPHRRTPSGPAVVLVDNRDCITCVSVGTGLLGDDGKVWVWAEGDGTGRNRGPGVVNHAVETLKQYSFHKIFTRAGPMSETPAREGVGRTERPLRRFTTDTVADRGKVAVRPKTWLCTRTEDTLVCKSKVTLFTRPHVTTQYNVDVPVKNMLDGSTKGLAGPRAGVGGRCRRTG